MSNEMIPAGTGSAEAFQRRIFDKIKNQLGDLLTEDELRPMVEKAVQQAFFERRTVRGRYGDNETHEPVFVTLMREHLQTQVRLQVDQWVAANPTVLAGAAEAVVREGIAKAVLGVLEQRIQGPLWTLTQALQQKGIV